MQPFYEKRDADVLYQKLKEYIKPGIGVPPKRTLACDWGTSQSFQAGDRDLSAVVHITRAKVEEIVQIERNTESREGFKRMMERLWARYGGPAGPPGGAHGTTGDGGALIPANKDNVAQLPDPPACSAASLAARSSPEHKVPSASAPMQSDDSRRGDPLRSLLEACTLLQYYENLKNEGFELLEDLMGLTEEDLRECGINKRAHVRRILKRVKAMNI